MLVASSQGPASKSILGLRPAGIRLRYTWGQHGRMQCCRATSLPALESENLVSTATLFELNELLQSHSLPGGDVSTMAMAFRKLTYMASQSPEHFKVLGMHEHVYKLCQEFQVLSSAEVSLDHVADILGGLEDLVTDCDDLHMEHSSIQGCVQVLTDTAVSSWDAWYIPDQPCNHTSITTVIVSIAALSQAPTEHVRELAQKAASAFVSILECSAMRSPALTPTTDLVDLIQSMSRVFPVIKDSEECSGRSSEAWQSLTECRTHTMPQQSVQSESADIKWSSRANMERDGQDAVQPLPVIAAEDLPQDVKAFVNDACEELRMRILPAVHSVNPPVNANDVVKLLSALADLKILSPAVHGCTDATLTLLKYRLKQGLVTSMCPYPYTVSSVSDMSQVSEALLKLGHSGILLNEVIHLMLLTLAKIWASPPSEGGNMNPSALRRSVGTSLEFCGPSVVSIMKNAVRMGVYKLPTVFQLACEPYWAGVSRTQELSQNVCTREDEVLATLPQFMTAAKLRTSDTLASCISHALSVCSLQLPIKARNLYHLAILSSIRSHVHVRNSIKVICDSTVPYDWQNLCEVYGAQTTAVLLGDLLDAAMCIYSQCSEPLAGAAAEFLAAKRQSVHAQTAKQLATCLRLSDVQFASMSCALHSTTGESGSARECDQDDDCQHLPLSLCPVCHGHDIDVLQQSDVVLRGLDHACVEADTCPTVSVDCWESVLLAYGESIAQPISPHPSQWDHRVLQIFRGKELWMHGIIFIESFDHARIRVATAIVLAPHIQSSSPSAHSQDPPTCWDLALCTTLAGPMGRIGALLQAEGIQAVALIPRDWMALQAVAQQQGNRSQLRHIVDGALSLAAKGRAL